MCEGDTEKTKHDLPVEVSLGQGDDSVGKVLERQARVRCEFTYVKKKKKTGCALTWILTCALGRWRQTFPGAC